MPYLNVKLSVPPSEKLSADITARLTELTAALLHKKRELTSVTVEYLPPGQWFIGGNSLVGQDSTTFYLEIKVAAGTNTKDEKAAFISQAFATIASLIGKLHPTSYVVIHEVDGDAWGYQGKTQEFRYIQGKPL